MIPNAVTISSSYYAESIKWADKRTAQEHTAATVDEGFDGVFEVAAEFTHALANKLETDAMLVQWSAAFTCTGGVATLRTAVGKAMKIWAKHRLGKTLLRLVNKAPFSLSFGSVVRKMALVQKATFYEP